MDLFRKVIDDTSKWLNYEIKGIIYVCTQPTITRDRMVQRNRKEDSTLPLEYLQDLHQLHDEWLVDNQKNSLPVLIYQNKTSLTIDNFEKIKGEIEKWAQNPIYKTINPELH